MPSLSRVMCCSSLSLMLLGAGSVDAQSGVVLRGTVMDPAGSAVSGIVLQLTRAGQPVEDAISSAGGVFRFKAVPPGNYGLVTPAFQGLAAREIPVAISASNPPLAIVLTPATVVETIQVDGGKTLSTAAADNKDTVTVSGDALGNLPVFDQDPISTLLPFLDPSSTASGGVSIIVDGVELKGLTVTPSAIAEMRINSDPYSAEYATPGRGRIEITTKPGSPLYHGTFNFIFRDSDLNARNYFAPTRAPEQRRIYEGNFSGPVGHGGHTTLLVSATRREEDLQSAVHAVGPPGQFGFDALGNLFENVSTPSRHTQANGHVTHDFSDQHRLNAGYNYDELARKNRNVGGTVLPEAAYNNDSREDDFILNDRLILTPNLIQQLAIVAEKDEYVSTPLMNAPSILVDGAFTAGGAQNSGFSTSENTIHITEIISWTHKKHYLRFGVSNPMQLSRRAVDDHSDRLGTFNFNSVADFEHGTPYKFTVQQGNGRAFFWFNPIDGFVQDEIALRKNLQVTVGLRYQWQTYVDDLHSFAPRLSFAYSPTPQWVVRGGAGIFYDRFGGDYGAAFKLHNGVVLHQVQVLNPVYPYTPILAQQYLSLPSNIVRESRDLQAPMLVEYSAGVERQLGKSLTATATYRGITGIRLFRARDANAPLAPYTFGRPDPSIGFVHLLESEGRSRLNALELGLHGGFGKIFTGQMQYTLSRSYDNTDGLSFFPQNQYAPGDEWGRSTFDRLQRFNILASIYPGRWLNLGFASGLSSGAPYNELAGSDFFTTGLGNARPAGIGRNTLQGSGNINVDLSWNHDLPLTPRRNRLSAKDRNILNFGVSAFNILNHSDFWATSYVGNIRSPLFRHPTTAFAPRQMQFQLRYQF